MTDSTQPHLHLVSDSTGETLNTIFRSAMARFKGVEPQVHVSVFVRNAADMQAAIDKITRNPGLVLHTVADRVLREQLLGYCEDQGLTAVPAIDPVISALSGHFGVQPAARAGMQHGITSDYFERISALDFAIAYDDGALGQRLQQADVILTGVSRTSKTPTCIYLAYRGIKAANVPLVPRVSPDPAFFQAIERGVPVIGLTASPSRLSQVRGERLETIGSTKTADYAEIDQIRAEVAEARLFFDRYELPVIDDTRRSTEVTAAEIMAILREQGTDSA